MIWMIRNDLLHDLLPGHFSLGQDLLHAQLLPYRNIILTYVLTPQVRNPWADHVHEENAAERQVSYQGVVGTFKISPLVHCRFPPPSLCYKLALAEPNLKIPPIEHCQYFSFSLDLAGVNRSQFSIKFHPP